MRRAKRFDAVVVKAVAEASWRSTYANLLRPATIDRFLSGPYDDANLERRIVEHQFLVAVDGDSVVGYVDGVVEPDRILLAAIYVLPQRVGEGIGSRLLVALLATAPHLPVDALVLQGNERAEAFYARRGFRAMESITGALLGEEVTERRWRKAESAPSSRGPHPAFAGAPFIRGADHLQLAMPADGEERARAFYAGVLGLREVRKPPELATRGGCWFVGPGLDIHLGVEEEFRPARKAHVAFLVADIDAARSRFHEPGVPIAEDNSGLAVRRFYVQDPFGNRIEILDERDRGFTRRNTMV